MADFGAVTVGWARRLVASLLACAPFVLPLGPAHAAFIIQAESFGTGGTPSTFVQFPGFDPELGTLLSVRVELSGMLSFDVLVLPGESVAPIVQFDAFGAAGTGFDFSGSGTLFMFGGVSNPPPTEFDPGRAFLMKYATSIFLDFTVTGFTDLLGGIVVPDVSASGVGVVPPAIVEAHRSDFIPDPVALGIPEILTFMPLGFTPLGGLNAAGAVILTYDYVDLNANPVTNVSAPPGVAVFAVALMALWRRRRAAARPA